MTEHNEELIVLKVGGAKGIDYDKVLEDAAEFKKLVLIHGGSGELNDVSARLGKPPKTVTSASGHVSRRTDRETLEIFNMVYAGKMNKMIVEKLQALGVNALGLSGMDGRLLQGRRKNIIIKEDGKKKVIRDDFTGKVEDVNTDLLNMLMDSGYLPVITPPAISTNHEAINVDGDRAAARIATALGADTLVILSNIPGLLRDPEDETTLVEEINSDNMEEAMSLAKGRMKKKVMGAGEALEDGVKRVIFGDARIDKPVTRALAGQGTVISR